MIKRVLSRKHTLNCHRMKPALFQILCEIKEKTGLQSSHFVVYHFALLTTMLMLLIAVVRFGD